jgi:hypothetical protein
VNSLITIIGRGVAGQRYKSILQGTLPSHKLIFWSRTQDLMHSHCIIICSSTKNHFEDFITAHKYSSRILIEKPVATELSELIRISKIAKENNIFLCTGDQFNFSKLLHLIKEHISSYGDDEQINIDISYRDSLSNVTKNNKESYFYDDETGGVLYTFSHAYFILAKIFSMGLTLNYSKIKKHPSTNIDIYASSNWSYKNINVNVITDCENEKLEFSLIINKESKYDFINGQIETLNSKTNFKNNDRFSLIEKCTENLLSGKDGNQFKTSYRALEYIWKVKKWN